MKYASLVTIATLAACVAGCDFNDTATNSPACSNTDVQHNVTSQLSKYMLKDDAYKVPPVMKLVSIYTDERGQYKSMCGADVETDWTVLDNEKQGASDDGKRHTSVPITYTAQETDDKTQTLVAIHK